MRHPEFTCAHCGSGELRRSHSTSLLDLPKLALGKYPFRCLDCRERTWIDLFRKGRQARCPRCLTADLSPAPSQKIRVGFWQRQMLRRGARLYRCNFCGHKFATFKRRHTDSVEKAPGSADPTPKPAPQMASAAGAGK